MRFYLVIFECSIPKTSENSAPLSVRKHWKISLNKSAPSNTYNSSKIVTVDLAVLSGII